MYSQSDCCCVHCCSDTGLCQPVIVTASQPIRAQDRDRPFVLRWALPLHVQVASVWKPQSAGGAMRFKTACCYTAN